MTFTEIKLVFANTFSGGVARRLAMTLFALGMVATVITTAGQTYRDYREELILVEKRFEYIRTTHGKNLAASVWTYSNNQIETELQGLLNTPDIEYANIQTPDGDMWSVGEKTSSDAIIEEIPLIISDGGNDHVLGVLTVVVIKQGIYDRIFDRGMNTLSFSAFWTLILTATLFLVFRQLVTRHLVTLANYTSSISFDADASPVKLDRNRAPTTSIDELDHVANAINNMRTQLVGSIQEIKQSEESLRTAQRIAKLGNWDWNMETGGLWWSDEIYRIFGLKRRELEATYETFLKSVHPDDRAKLESAVGMALEGKPYDIEHRIVLPGGEERIVHERGEVTFDDDAKPVRMLGTIIDITERKQAENILHSLVEGTSADIGMDFFHHLVQHLANGLGVDCAFIGELPSDAPGNVRTTAVWAKDRIVENFDYELVGTPCQNVVGKEICCYPDHIQQLFPADHLLVDMSVEAYAGVPLFSRDGTPLGVMVALDGKPMQNPEAVTSMLSIFAARVGAELERQKIEKELRESEEYLRLALVDAERANEAKSEFLASMSHELRTPLNAVLGFAQMLQFDPKNPLSSAQHEHIESIMGGGNHLLELVNEILDLTRIEADRASLLLKDVIANDVVADCVALTIPIGKKRNIMIVDQLSSTPSTHLHTDPLRLKQIVINLISNAIKFNKDSGRVTVNGQETEDDFFRISVTDTGVGIAKEDRASIFHPFSRHGTDSMVAQEGTGIGLTVTKLLVERMAGRVGLESEVGVGSTFWIELPLASNEKALIWVDSLRVGVDVIDKDHQVLISLLNRVTRQSLNDPELEVVIEELIDYTHYHFMREEVVMEACGYPDLDEHLGYHKKLVTELNDLADAWRKDRDPEILYHLRTFLREWLFNHISNEDTKISSYAEGKDQDIKKALESLK